VSARIRALWKWRYLFTHLVSRELHARHRRTVLGPLWTLVAPLMTLAVYWMVFQRILGLGVENYPVFLLAGLIPWMWFSSAATLSAGSLRRDGNLIRKCSFPTELLPLRWLIVTGIDCLIGLGLLCLACLVSGYGASLRFFVLLCAVGLQLIVLSSCVVALALVGAVCRDVEHALSSLLRLAFFATPIAYSLQSVPAAYRPFFALNPMTYVVGLYRAAILGTPVPSLAVLFGLSVAGLLALGFAWHLMVLRSPMLAEVV